jgi:hypothetical protein
MCVGKMIFGDFADLFANLVQGRWYLTGEKEGAKRAFFSQKHI